MTRLTAEPPLIQFDTFEMLEEYQFTTYSRRFNLRKSNFHNISEIAKIHTQYGSVFTNEALPFVSELWFELMLSLKPFEKFQLGLYLLKDKIPQKMWKYINNSAMFPDYGPGHKQSISNILNFHMKWCNRSAFILKSGQAVILNTILKQMSKPSFLGKDKIIEMFWGYRFRGYFPPNIIFREKYIFEAGVFEWWQKHAEYSLILETNIHSNLLLPKPDN